MWTLATFSPSPSRNNTPNRPRLFATGKPGAFFSANTVSRRTKKGALRLLSGGRYCSVLTTLFAQKSDLSIMAPMKTLITSMNCTQKYTHWMGNPV